MNRRALQLISQATTEIVALRDNAVHQHVVGVLQATDIAELGSADAVWPSQLKDSGVANAWQLGCLSQRQVFALAPMDKSDLPRIADALGALVTSAVTSSSFAPNATRQNANDTALLLAVARLTYFKEAFSNVSEDMSWLKMRAIRKWKPNERESWVAYRRNSAQVVTTIESLSNTQAPAKTLSQLTLLRGPERGRLGRTNLWPVNRKVLPFQRDSEQVRPPKHGALPESIALQVEAIVLHAPAMRATLRQYQQFGAQYLLCQQRSVLGDDMGLGKTMQALAAMCHLAEEGKNRFLVVAPNNVLLNWQREIATHTTLHSFLLHGDQRDEKSLTWLEQGGIALTTFGTLGRLPLLNGEHPIPSVDMLVVDEAHFVKNPAAARTRTVQRIADAANYVALLTGTALENRFAEFRHLLHIANPSNDTLRLARRVGDGSFNPYEVQVLLAPIYLRRKQNDVLRELPELTEIRHDVKLTDDDLINYRLQTSLMHSRRAATQGASINTSPKYERLNELIAGYEQQDRKIVVFSFFRDVLTDVQTLVERQSKIACPIINGSVGAQERQHIIDNFTNHEGFAALALQIDSAGVGINLQAAEVVVLMEPQLKPSTEAQAIARVQRMGQAKPVTVHRFLAVNTVEEQIELWLTNKRQIFIDFADPSSVKEVSRMAMDPGTESFEDEWRRLQNDKNEG